VALAILLSSILFASIHLPIDEILFGYGELSFRQAFMTLFGGAIAGLLFYKSKSIIPPILYHMFWNLAAAIF
jgi:membrane protease YdiL (CAAX protease family)